VLGLVEGVEALVYRSFLHAPAFTDRGRVAGRTRGSEIAHPRREDRHGMDGTDALLRLQSCFDADSVTRR
jgi:hypothetical protein